MEILDTDGQVALYKEIIKNAKEFLIILCPFFQEIEERNFSKTVLQLLENNITVKKVLLIYRLKTKDAEHGILKEDFNKKILPILKTMKKNGACVYTKQLERLHAKGIMNERNAMVCSLNITDGSLANSELGVKIFNGKCSTLEDRKCYKEMLLNTASFYNVYAKRYWECYKLYKPEALKSDKKYKAKTRLNWLNAIDFEKTVFDETELEKL